MASRRFGMRDFSRVATWGLVALGALTIFAYAASSEIGEERLIAAVATIRGVPPPERLAADGPTRQLAAAVRGLTADRDQLLTRLDNLERNLGNVTASITRTSITPPPVVLPTPAAAPPAISAPDAAPAQPTQGIAVAAAPPTPTPSDEPAAPKTEFGVDLGRANSVEGLRQLWTAVKKRHAGALEGLRPIVTVREIARAGGIELRLVAGPLSNAAAAARVCAMLAGSACHPSVFDGQKLALR
jgi:hypothetical protein